MKYSVAIQCAFVLATWAAASSAVDKSVLSTARDLSEQGMADFEAGRYDAAAEKLLQVYATVPLPSSAHNAARALAKQGKLVKAAGLLFECTQMQPSELWRGKIQQTVQEDCERERSALLARTPRLTVVLHGADYGEVDITIDDLPVPAGLSRAEQLVDPGKHHIAAARGTQTAVQDIELAEGQRSQAELTFETPAAVPVTSGPAPATAAPRHTEARRGSNRKTWAIVSGAVGVVGLGVGTGMVLMAEHKYSNAGCGDNNQCSRAGADDRSSAIHTANWSMLPLGIGLAGVGAGLTLWFMKPSGDNERPSTGLVVSPNQVGVRGRF